MNNMCTSSTSLADAWTHAEDHITPFFRDVFQRKIGNSRHASILAFLNALEGYLRRSDIDYSIQALSWLAEMFGSLEKEGDRSSVAAIWEWVERIIQRDVNGKWRFAMCYTFLFPLIDAPQDANVMKDVVALYGDELTREYLNEAYSHLEDASALEKDLNKYR